MLKMILGTMSNNIYMQIALIMLMGLLAKNAILIVEFALDRRKMGMSITWAAVLGAGARLRPILMTSPGDGSRSASVDVCLRCRCSW